jgi:antitoxin VapB
MVKKTFTEQELLEGLDAHTAHADELAEPLTQELMPLERLKGSVKLYERPTDPVWQEYFDASEGVTDDFMEDRGSGFRPVKTKPLIQKETQHESTLQSHQQYSSRSPGYRLVARPLQNGNSNVGAGVP